MSSNTVKGSNAKGWEKVLTHEWRKFTFKQQLCSQLYYWTTPDKAATSGMSIKRVPNPIPQTWSRDNDGEKSTLSIDQILQR